MKRRNAKHLKALIDYFRSKRAMETLEPGQLEAVVKHLKLLGHAQDTANRRRADVEFETVCELFRQMFER